MNSNRRKIYTNNLQLGMFVSDLDRPWLEVPFLLQGVKLERREQVDVLKKHCDYVYIDINKGIYDNSDISLSEGRTLEEKSKIIGRQAKDYNDSETIEAELVDAKKCHSKLFADFDKFYDDIKYSRNFDVNNLKPSLNQMVESVIRNPDAFVWLAKLKNVNADAYSHSISSAIWAVSFGRQLGLRKTDLNNLAMGAVLFDIGKLRVPQKLLAKKAHLTDIEFNEIKKHVEYGLDILKGTKGLNVRIREMVQSHHERFDGSGYPDGLKGNKIPLFARIASIVDCYDAITSARPYRKGMSPSEAVKRLYEWRGKDFQPELIEEFIQAVGIYPSGTLVELSTGEVGVVMAEYRTRRLRPKLMMILDKKKQFLNEFRNLDLSETLYDKNRKLLEIKQALEPGSFDIDTQKLYL